MFSKNDLRLKDLVLSEKILTLEQINSLLQMSEVQDTLQKGISLLSVLKEKQLIEEAQFQKILKQHILVECPTCSSSYQVLGPELPPDLKCRFCQTLINQSNSDEEDFDKTRRIQAESCDSNEMNIELKKVLKENFIQENEKTHDYGTKKNFETTQTTVPKQEDFGSIKEQELTTIGGCQVLYKLGQGGMGAIYLAEHLILKKKVAIKILLPELVSEHSVKRFFLEAQSIANIEHPNVVQIRDVGQEGDYYYLIMQYIDGHTLEEEIRENVFLEWQYATKLIIEAAKGLVEIHKHGIIHRDIKPENIMISNKGSVKLTDFGLVRELDSKLGLSASGDLIGTPYFMSPEQCAAEKVDSRSDIYALGTSYYYALTGKKPFQAENLAQLVLKKLQENPVSIRTHKPELPIQLDGIFDRMLAKSPQNRYATAEKLIKDLNLLLAGKLEIKEEEQITKEVKTPLKPKNSSDTSQKLIGSNQYWQSPNLSASMQTLEQSKDLLQRGHYKEVREKLFKTESFSTVEEKVKALRIIQDSFQQELQQKLDVRNLKDVLELAQEASQHFPNEKDLFPVAVLIRALKQPEEDLRRRAAQYFGDLGEEGKEGIPALLDVLTEPNEYLNMTVANSLAKIVQKLNTLPSQFQEGLSSPSENLRYWILFILGKLKRQETVPLLIFALKDNAKRVKLEAIKHLGKLGEKATAAISSLQITLKDSDPTVAKAAEKALKWIQ